MTRTFLLHLTLFVVAQVLVCDGVRYVKPDRSEGGPHACSLSQELIDEIAGYSEVANSIINAVKDGDFKGKTYNDLEKFVDKFGGRISGSESLENSIDYMLDFFKENNLNISAEEVGVPNWIRGDEVAQMLLPRNKILGMLGLGLSIGTPPQGIEAEVLVVSSFDELKEKAKLAKGKIVVFNQEYEDYGETVKYRITGANEAAKVGAVAVLIRSITPFSLYSPHTGVLIYEDNGPQIPAACITVEDAKFMSRLQEAGERIVVSLNMGATTLPLAKSRNAIGEIIGSEKPEEVVLVSGHIDSWDVGQGALDDGGGMMMSAQAVALVSSLNLKPKRTLRAVMWTAEEYALWGAKSYLEKHREELDNFKAVIESDSGAFRPLGLDFAGTTEAGCIVEEILKLLAPINATEFRMQEEVGSDISVFIPENVPALGLNNENSNYFNYHHTNADTIDILEPEDLDFGTALFAVVSYVLADLSVELPRATSK